MLSSHAALAGPFPFGLGGRFQLTRKGVRPLVFSLRFPRWARVLLAFWLVPLVMFSTPTVANAATSGKLSFGFDNDITCQVPWALSTNGTGLVIGSASRCDGGPDYSPGGCQPAEGECGEWALVAKDPSGATVGQVAFEESDDPSNTIGSVATKLGGGYMPLSASPAEVCLSFYLDRPGVRGAWDWVQCQGIDVDSPEVPTDCQYGYPVRVSLRTDTQPEGVLARTRSYLRVELSEGHSGWYFNVLMQFPGYELPDPVTEASGGGAVQTTNPTNEIVVWEQVHYQGDAPAAPRLIGVSLYRQDSGTGSIFGHYAPPTGWFGTTAPALCRFWFGPKIVELPDSDADEPWRPVSDGDDDGGGQDPDPADEVDVPVDDTPDTDSGIWAAILAMLRAIVGAVKSLAGAIAGLARVILSGLKDLFIPSGDGWDVADLRDELETKPPFSIAAEFGDQAVDFTSAYSSAGSCGVLANFGPDLSPDCSQIRNSPGMGGLYSLVAAGMIGLTVWSTVLIIQRTFSESS